MSENGLADLPRLFEEAEQALKEARDRLSELGDAGELAGKSADSLRESATAVQGFATQAGDAAQALQSVQEQIRTLLERASNLLTGDDFRNLSASVTELRDAVEKRFEELEGRVAAVEQLEQERDRLRKELEHIKLHVPQRHLKKALQTLAAE